MQQEIVCISKFWDISGVWKAFQFWYVFIRRFDIIYLKTLVKSTIFFLAWYLLSPGHTTKNSAWYILIIRYLKSLKYKNVSHPLNFFAAVTVQIVVCSHVDCVSESLVTVSFRVCCYRRLHHIKYCSLVLKCWLDFNGSSSLN